jgi:hypothetical protein
MEAPSALLIPALHTPMVLTARPAVPAGAVLVHLPFVFS